MSLLPDADAFKRLVDGSARGIGPALARAALAGLSAPYAAAVACRNAAYDRGLLAAHSGGVPVVSVGNLTLGGTGKTPLVAWLARTWLERGLRPAIVSRGYGAARGTRSDEAAELAIVLPDVPHVADRDRVAAVRRAAAAGAEIVVVDDGFQHRRLARDLDILAVDATDPWGCGRLFPRGLLREPLSGAARAHAVVLTRADAVGRDERLAIRRRLERLPRRGPPLVWVESTHRPLRLRSAAGGTRPLAALAGARMAAFAGIGNPTAFRRAVEDQGARVVGFQAWPDHHAYAETDAVELGRWARALGADFVVTTLKDLVKLPVDRLGDVPLYALEIALEVLAGGDDLAALVEPVAGRAAAGRVA
jgi:tetraacyldisaccharide 4'-kinase